ncbi:hypothetical protein [Mitsuaria sp. GD03876]|uniref:hypothetical protein n=1 Tax=Mitsuaria sp. GD03876 TaxID=2975399 RepID=UPI002446A351|nr:hypothetical protein [Mitsuaria sp. GD03876]MDH0864659.1 hypothetical protein [Mitsuaria sp. GD03876]
MKTMLAFARAIANAALVFEFSEDSQVDSDLAVQALEQMANDLQRLSTEDQHVLSETFMSLSSAYPYPPHAEFVSSLGTLLGLADEHRNITPTA